MEIVNSAALSVVPHVTSSIIKHMAYPINVRSNVFSLESATRELQAVKEDVKNTIRNAERENGMPTEQVNLWLADVEPIEQKAAEIQQNYQQLCRCLGTISPNLWSIYKISRSAAMKQVQVRSLLDRRATIEVIMHTPPPLAQEIPASSYKSPNLDIALHHIKDDVHGTIGIWGMGGVGKTHLLKQVNNELCKDGAFDVLVFVTCSKDCSDEKVQDEIINKLKLNKIDNMEQNKITIYSFLKQRCFVLLLDDMWNRVDLEAIGIPDPMVTVGTCKRKVVLTTRSMEVCGQMEVTKKIRVDVLNWIDAWSLFKEKVSEETIDSDPLIQRYAVDVANELGGLPLALITVGRAMRDKMDPSEWEQALELLKKARLDDVESLSTNKSVFHTLNFSYDSLKTDTLKRCFLLCSLWPEDHHIKKNDLVELWMGLGLIDEPNIHAAYNLGYIYIRRLQAACLLVKTDDEDDDEYIKMHDVIRDMALWIANNQGNEKNKWIVQAGTFKKSTEIEISHGTEKLSLMCARTKKVFLSTRCSSTNLSALMLNCNELSDSKPLQLALFPKLTFLDLSHNILEAFPTEICKLVLLQFLNLSFNCLLKSLPEELAALSNLKYLILRGTEECIIPTGVLSKLKALRVLDVRNNYHIRGTEGDFRNFTSLEEELQHLPLFQALGITISNMRDFQKLSQTSTVPVRWLTIEDFKAEENYLPFSSYFLGNSQLQNNLVSLELNGMRVINWVKFERTSYGRSICHLERLEHLVIRRMWSMKEIVWMGLDPKYVFFRLQVLKFIECDQLKSISWVACLPCIRELTVEFCINIKQLMSIDEVNNDGLIVCQPSFPFLKKMILTYNDALESICDVMITFPALEILKVDTCNKLLELPFKTGNPPRKLRLEGTEEWWNNLQMDDINHRTLLQPFFQKVYSY